MKILMLSRLFYPHKGGVEKHVLSLAAELMKFDVQISILTEQYDLNLKTVEQYQGIQIRRIPYNLLNKKIGLWSYIFAQRSWIFQHNIVHVHDVFWWILPLIFQFKYYITFHGYEGSKSPRWQALLHRKIAELLSEKTICIGDFMKKWYKANPHKVLYGASSITSSNINNKIQGAVFYGRFDDDTGILEYIKSIKLFKNKIRLKIYGEGPQMDIVKTMNSNNKLIELNPWNNDVESLIHNSRYVFVSRYLSILEAMQAKRLVFAVYNNEIKKDYLFCHPMADNMVIAGSAEELAEKFNTLTEEQEHIMVERAYAWAREQTWEKLANQYKELWGTI
jgi:glycosyltransferase involved in cell wall biosynthesis